jgi:Gas vesicle protein
MTERGVGLATDREVSLVEVLDRALGAGVVLTGDVTISLADVDLVYLSLRVLVGSVGTLEGGQDAAELMPGASSVVDG